MATFYMEDGTSVHTTIKSMIGRRVRTTAELRNNWTIIPEGTVLVIEGSTPRADVTDGVALVGEPCPHCSVRVRITGVTARHFEVLR